MEQPTRGRDKARALREHGTLNPEPERVHSELFGGEFFDAEDMMQVKYEMLRAVHHDDRSITEATAEFGLSRPAFYRARRDFEQAGLAGLVPRKRGPKAPHKLTPDILQFIREQVDADKRVRAQQLRDRINVEFGTHVHTRTVQRAMVRGEKGGHRG